MKRAGEVLSAIFDERLMQKARGYSLLFDYWTTAAQKYGIAAAADHSRIKELDRGILLVEADHPGWIQILQTQENNILDDFRRRFPGMDISGISLMLSRGGTPQDGEPAETTAGKNEEAPSAANPRANPPKSSALPAMESSGYDTIKDKGLKETLKRLEQSISAKESGRER
ncbi:MAG: DUF721 domain-containing protein [Treponema sp.]|jgi:hypothetical protein|nr:DUF721 domain-containing protein [Treponema sp.]